MRNQVRIIGGRWRGRRLSFPAHAQLRPTHDRVRETLFNWLMHDVVDARCLDLFAGSGALGFEALSRGAAQVTFVEQQTAAVEALHQNAQQLAAQPIEIMADDVLRYLTQRCQVPFDIVFCDPPYHQQLLAPTAKLLEANCYLSPEARIYLEAEKNFDCSQLPKNWRCFRSKSTSTLDYYLFHRESVSMEKS